MKNRGGNRSNHYLRQSKKSKSCEDLISHPTAAGNDSSSQCQAQRGGGAAAQQQMKSKLSGKENDSTRSTYYHLNPTSNTHHHHHRSYRGTTLTAGAGVTAGTTTSHYPYECPVEIQTQRALSEEERERAVVGMEEEFRARRKVVISGLPYSSTEEELDSFFSDFSCTPVSRVKDGTVRVLFPTADNAKETVILLNSTMYKCHRLTASFGHADSLLFVGNLPFTYTRDDLHKLFSPHGEILRCFVVCSLRSGLSKGYGFVELARREEAIHAKQMMATKVVGLRSLRVDFSDNGMQTVEDLHSQTLFVDRLPKGFKDDTSLREIFEDYGRVNFCQVAVTMGTGVSRGFAFVDMSSYDEAERAQVGCNGAEFVGQELRVSFGMPCRHGACILQHRNVVSFNAAGKLIETTRLPPSAAAMKENHHLFSSPSSHYHPHFHHTLTPSHHHMFTSETIDGSTHFHHRHTPLTDTSNICRYRGPGGLRKAESFTCLSVVGLPPMTSSHSCGGVSQSISAPTILTGTQPSSPLDWRGEEKKEEECTSSRPLLLGKRPAPSEREDTGLSSSELGPGAYDKLYIGQHQQGIPFTHPLKRIRME